MKYLQKYMEAKDKKILMYLVMIAAAGAMLMLWGRAERRAEAPTQAEEPQAITAFANQPEPTASPPQAPRPERAIEEELETFLSLVEGAGRVRVMVSAFGGRETVFAVDTTSNRSYILEEDAQGGSRDQRQHSTQEQTVIITDRNGLDQPLILREIEHSIEGIVIIAEGGGDPLIRDALTRAAMAVLGTEAHRVQVLSMAQTEPTQNP